MLGCSSELQTALHHRVRVDATVGRQIEDTVNELAGLRRHHKLPKTIVIQVGNNGPLWYRDLKRLRHALHGIPRRRRRQRPQRDELAGRVEPRARQLGARLARRRISPTGTGSSTNKMLSDGTHPWPYACTIYARLIADTLRSS